MCRTERVKGMDKGKVSCWNSKSKNEDIRSKVKAIYWKVYRCVGGSLGDA